MKNVVCSAVNVSFSGEKKHNLPGEVGYTSADVRKRSSH